MTVYRLAWRHLRDRKFQLFAIAVLQIAQVLLGLTLPALGANVIDYGILERNSSYIWSRGLLMGLFTLAQVLCAIGAIYYGALVSTHLGRELRRETFAHVQRFSPADQQRFGASTLVTRTTNDVNQIQMVTLMSLTIMVTAPIMGVGGVLMAIGQDVVLSLTLLVIIPVLTAIILVCTAMLATRYETLQRRVDAINDALRSQLSGVRVIRAFRREEAMAGEFEVHNRNFRSIMLQIGTIWSALLPAMSAVIGLASALIVWIGGHRIAGGSMPVGALAAFITYLMMILGAVMMLGMIIMVVPRGNVSAERVIEVNTTVPSIADAPDAREMPPGPVTFRLRDISLTYADADEPALRGISLCFRPGTTTAIIGASGSGKSSLVKILPRLVDVSTGRFTVEGSAGAGADGETGETETSGTAARGAGASEVDVRDIRLADFRRRVALVPQRAFLFSGTVASNVAGSTRDIDQERVINALHCAQAWDFVQAGGGLEMPVETGGSNLSGGQRQRLTIARALYRALPDSSGRAGADLVVFDDSFSALDYATDARVRANLKERIRDAAVVIIAQRISTTRSADCVVVLDCGEVVGCGTHAELMETNEMYRSIVRSQERGPEGGAERGTEANGTERGTAASDTEPSGTATATSEEVRA
ncbi:ABC transporter ATP-binding protein [Actinotignum sp. GS-2025f]|uniref:ABC transporter ATP-binding protein n=1 Tax=unclassified Actinotignum TaxID=2632702 RepID=UPI002A7EDDC7|nr:ABC transporter ATP-binding protein [Actinotignum sp. SLA_B059]MDY5127483.1 ABC transporter ATP-binding protein [Actinotignum sp. SLA_B059]